MKALVNQRSPIDYQRLIAQGQVLLIDDFYSDTSWLDELAATPTQVPAPAERILHLPPELRQRLQSEVAELFPGTHYPSDAGWIRSTIRTKEALPISRLHSDHPYLVLSICLSSQGDEVVEEQGTTFYRHRDLGFKSLFHPQHFRHFHNIFLHHRDREEMWSPWFSYVFKKNRAIVYPGSLLHRMPGPGFGDCFANSRLMQIFNFRPPTPVSP